MGREMEKEIYKYMVCNDNCTRTSTVVTNLVGKSMPTLYKTALQLK